MFLLCAETEDCICVRNLKRKKEERERGRKEFGLALVEESRAPLLNEVGRVCEKEVWVCVLCEGRLR